MSDLRVILVYSYTTRVAGQVFNLKFDSCPPTLVVPVKSDIQFDPKLLGKALREMREFLRLSLRELARNSGVSHSQILRIESGEFDCFTSSFVRLCSAMGIRFGDLIERCVKPEYDLYRNAIEVELKAANINNLDSDSKEALRDLVFGASIALGCLLRASWPTGVARELDYPTEAIRGKFIAFAEYLETQQVDFSRRYIILNGLQQKPIDTLQRFLNFPSHKEVESHASFAKTKNAELIAPWNPFRCLPSFSIVGYMAGAENHGDKNNLTTTSEIRKREDVKSEIQKLLARVRTLVVPKGMKAKLAADLKIPQSRLSEWLAGKYEPSGESTLGLLRWVEQQERQK